MIQIFKIFVIFIFIHFATCIEVAPSISIDSHLIDDKNINWMGAIFTRSSKFVPFEYKCQGIFVDAKIIYTVDTCIGALDPVENIRVRVYKASVGANSEATDFEEHEVEHIGWQRFYLSPSAPSIPVRRLIHLYLKTPFNLQLNVEFPTKNNNKYNIENNIDINSCVYTSLQRNNNGFDIKQSKAKYVTTKETCCDEGDHVCVACNIGRKVYCARPVGASVESLDQNELLASPLACKSKSKDSILIVGISVNTTKCALRFTTL